MKNLIIPFFLILALNSFSQKIKGKVFGSNKNPLVEANIYFDGTTFRTTTDENGNFTLNFDAEAKNILVVSFMGYQTEYISNFDIDKELIIYLVPKMNTLKEVVIQRKDRFTRKQKLQLFREQFLGLTTNGKLSIIKNEDDIYFKYDKNKYILKAYSDNPLTILNPSLGYKIEYDLVSFEVTFSSHKINSEYAIKSFYKGFSHFEEINNSNEILLRREKAYQGSEINFFRNLKNNNLRGGHFLLKVKNDNVAANDCFKTYEENYCVKIVVKPQQKDLKNLNSIASYDIVYDKKEYSNITFETNTFNVYKYGNYSNIENIIFSGKISEKRVGDMLPFDYYSKEIPLKL
jgi:hypothetical protein